MTRFLQIDFAIRAWIVLHRVPALDHIMWGISAAGRGGLVFLAIGLMLTIARRMRPRDLAQLVLAILATSVLCDQILKPAIGRDRPFVRTADVAVIGTSPQDASFPSGHTATAFAGAVVLGRFAAALTPFWWLLAAAIGYSRIYVGVHYPSDVVGGALIGMACATAILAGCRRVTHR
jgi:undecaprenyl-diphosphatase